MQGGAQTFAELSKRKAFELAYAIFRITRVISSRSFAERMEQHAAALIEEAVAKNHDGLEVHLETLDYFLRLGVEAGFIYQSHAETIFNEINLYSQALAEHSLREAPPAVSLEGVFSKVDFHPEQAKHDYEAMKVEIPMKPNDLPPVDISFIGDRVDRPARDPAGHRKSGEERRMKILEVVKQNGQVKMKDVQSALPDVSERTLRYDLQNLVEDRLLKRLGDSGPMVSYSVVDRQEDVGSANDSAKIERAFSQYLE